MTDRERDDSHQNPLTHEGAPPDGRDDNEAADDKATVIDQEGEHAAE